MAAERAAIWEGVMVAPEVKKQQAWTLLARLCLGLKSGLVAHPIP
jgi:hypothetical protein